jgi:hypothetical protein
VSINGSQVAADGGPNDADPAAGVIALDLTLDGWRVRLLAQTALSTDAAGRLRTSELLVERLDPGSPNALVIDIGESAFLTPAQSGPSLLSTTLTRDRIDGVRTSGRVGLTTTATDLAGNTATATAPTLTPSESGGTPTTASFDRQTREYSLRSVITVRGLGVGHGVSVTADASVIPNPAPPAAVLALTGLPVLLLARRLRRRD